MKRLFDTAVEQSSRVIRGRHRGRDSQILLHNFHAFSGRFGRKAQPCIGQTAPLIFAFIGEIDCLAIQDLISAAKGGHDREALAAAVR